MTKILKNIMVGSDPELFVFDKIEKDFVPSIDLIGGSKQIPRPTSVAGFSVQEDNVLAEFNIPPSKSMDDFRNNIKLGIDLFKEFLPEERYQLIVTSSHNFREDQLFDPRARELGCDPDRNAWRNGKFNNIPKLPTDGLRSAGGHIHIGYDLDKKDIAKMTK